jgi:hypothetical protein
MDLGSSVFTSLASWGWVGVGFNLPSSYRDTQEYFYFVGVFFGSILMWKNEHILSNMSYVVFFERKYQIVTWGGKHMFCCLGDCRSGTTMFHIRSWCHSRQIKTG